MSVGPTMRSVLQLVAAQRRNAVALVAVAAVPATFAVWLHVLALTPGGFLARGLAPLVGNEQGVVAASPVWPSPRRAEAAAGAAAEQPRGQISDVHASP